MDHFGFAAGADESLHVSKPCFEVLKPLSPRLLFVERTVFLCLHGLSCFDQVSILCLEKPCRRNTSSTSLRHRRKALRLCSRLAWPGYRSCHRFCSYGQEAVRDSWSTVCELCTICLKAKKAKTLNTWVQRRLRRSWKKSTASWPGKCRKWQARYFWLAEMRLSGARHGCT